MLSTKHYSSSINTNYNLSPPFREGNWSSERLIDLTSQHTGSQPQLGVLPAGRVRMQLVQRLLKDGVTGWIVGLDQPENETPAELGQRGKSSGLAWLWNSGELSSSSDPDHGWASSFPRRSCFPSIG